MKHETLDLAIFISGNGTNMRAVVDASRPEGILNGLVLPKVVISSDANAGGVEKAKALGIPTEIIDYAGREQNEIGDHISQVLRKYEVNFCVLAGWLKLMPLNIVKEFKDRMINLHAAPLDPGMMDFGGRGMYGLATHLAVVAYAITTGKISSTESTVHLVTQDFDEGRILASLRMDFPFGVPSVSFEEIKRDPKQLIEFATVLQQTLLPKEHINIVHTLKLIARVGIDNLPQFTRLENLIDENDYALLSEIKQFAAKLSRKLEKQNKMEARIKQLARED